MSRCEYEGFVIESRTKQTILGNRIVASMLNLGWRYRSRSTGSTQRIRFDCRRIIVVVCRSREEGNGLSAVKSLSRQTRACEQECESPIEGFPLRSWSLAARTGGGTSAAGSSGSPVPATARIPRLGVFVPGYTRDILISPDLLFASFSPRLSSFLTLRVSSLSVLLYHSLPIYLFPLLPLFPWYSTLYLREISPAARSIFRIILASSNINNWKTRKIL